MSFAELYKRGIFVKTDWIFSGKFFAISGDKINHNLNDTAIIGTVRPINVHKKLTLKFYFLFSCSKETQ